MLSDVTKRVAGSSLAFAAPIGIFTPVRSYLVSSSSWLWRSPSSRGSPRSTRKRSRRRDVASGAWRARSGRRKSGGAWWGGTRWSGCSKSIPFSENTKQCEVSWSLNRCQQQAFISCQQFVLRRSRRKGFENFNIFWLMWPWLFFG